MRIALVTEEFVPSTAPTALVTREVAGRLTDAGHDVVVFAGGRGQATFRGARIFWASRMTTVSAFREAMALSRPDVCHLIDPHRVAMKAADAAERLGVPTVVVDSATWAPGVDLADHHPGLRDQGLHDRWALTSLREDRLVAGYVGPLVKRKVVSRLATIAQLPGVRLVVLGDGPGAESLRAAGAKVITRTSSLELACCVASLDVLVQPRKREIYAPAVLEALASGVPVIAFETGVAAQVVRHEHNGLLVGADRGGRAISRAVSRLAAHPDLRRGLAERARESVLDRTWEAAVDDLVASHYRAAVGDHPGAMAR